MAVLGIVAEYDPFHNGHLRHLRSAVSVVAPSAVLVALSGPFKQRGDPSLLSPFARAEAVLESGADAVFALPVCWTVRDAEHYALGAVSLLSSLGATHLAFGAETSDLSLLEKTASLLENPPPAMEKAVRVSLSGGSGWPAALAEAAGSILPESRSVLSRPNNILAVCYLRAVRRLGLSLVPIVIPRTGGYHSERIKPDAPSASALRAALCRGDWENAFPALPAVSARLIRSAFLAGNVPDFKKLDSILLMKLRSMTCMEVSRLPDCPEGLDAALIGAARSASSREELLAALTSRRYPTARISRLCTSALLDLTADRLRDLPLPDSALLLAMKKNPFITGSWKNSKIRISSAADYLNSADPAERSAWRLWALVCGLPASYPFTQRVLTQS